MLNRSANLVMSTSVLKTLPGKLDIKRHSSIILYLLHIIPKLHGSITFCQEGSRIGGYKGFYFHAQLVTAHKI